VLALFSLGAFIRFESTCVITVTCSVLVRFFCEYSMLRCVYYCITGGTMQAAVDLLRGAGAQIVACYTIVELQALKVSRKPLAADERLSRVIRTGTVLMNDFCLRWCVRANSVCERHVTRFFCAECGDCVVTTDFQSAKHANTIRYYPFQKSSDSNSFHVRFCGHSLAVRVIQ
jgi:hypothetical protein